MAVKYCDLPTIKYLLEKDIIELNDDTSRHAIVNKKISLIKYLIIEKGCPFTTCDIMNTIIKYDKLNFFKYFKDKYNVTIDKDDFKNIIKNDSEMFKICI